jgi:hypothetical protein
MQKKKVIAARKCPLKRGGVQKLETPLYSSNYNLREKNK